MAVVTLTSGGLDSTLMALLVKEEGIQQHPLFINYGQLNCAREYAACTRNFEEHSLPTPTVMDISGYGKLVRCGLTDADLDVFNAAFLPGRNAMFLLMGASYACSIGASAVAIGLLNEDRALFPDQTSEFVRHMEELLNKVMRTRITVITPFIKMDKEMIYTEAKRFGLQGTYSCHRGDEAPCGVCIACREYSFLGGP